MEDESKQVFYGHFDECLEHFAVRFNRHFPKGQEGSAQARKPIQEFTGIRDEKPIRMWFSRKPGSKEGLPRGETYIRLVSFLELNGYGVIEFRDLEPHRRSFFELIGYGVLTAEQAASALDYTDTHELYRVLIRDMGMTDSREHKLWEMYKKHKAELEQKKTEAKSRYVLKLETTSKRALRSRSERKIPEPQGHPLRIPEVPIPRGIFPFQQATLTLMKSLLIILDADTLASLSKSDLEELRKSEASEMILRLSDHLSNLGVRLVTEKYRKGDTP